MTRQSTHPPARLGPRPLPLHLGLAMWRVTGSSAALPTSSGGWSGWKPELEERAAALQSELAAADPEALGRAVIAEGMRRFGALLTGIENYRRHPSRRDVTEPAPAWSEGTTVLRDYGGDGPPVLFVPSLINRAYILDLSRRRSLLRWLAMQGLNPWLVDWGAPGPEERDFTLDDYIAGRLARAFDVVAERTGRPVAVAGYCMGGLLALALAQLRREKTAGLILMATPWDFHAGDAARAKALAGLLPALEPQMAMFGGLPVDTLQALFAGLDPLGVGAKFEAFGRLDPDSDKARVFVALEDWLNDGVPLVSGVARDCIGGWYGENRPARGAWIIGGQPVDPGALDLPTLALIPARDRIVPPESALALVRVLPRCETITPGAGHIGMVVGGGMQRAVWEPLRDWIAALQ